jgi:hypothetical protein
MKTTAQRIPAYIVGILCLIIIAVFATLGTNNTDTVTPSGTETQAKLAEQEARSIAESQCIKGGQALGAGEYDLSFDKWLYDANLNATRPGCTSKCVVDEKIKKATVMWKCGGTLREL